MELPGSSDHSRQGILIIMQPLDKTLRNQLERKVKDARYIAETAARIALEQLGVGEPEPFSHLSKDERDLRRKLRVHGRNLGNGRSPDGRQELERLIDEVSYEHWHCMLFARFLAENNLLMYPDPDGSVAVTLEECEDLAGGKGAKNGWELASRFAARMLPQIFRPDSPVFQLALPPEHQQKLEKLVGELPTEVFTASDSIGWVYQFWQSKKKDEVNASEVKIGARELPAVTQLFTEPYMVSFLLDNSLGAWWAAQRLTKNDLATAKSEEELRQKASLPGVPLEYLRFVKGDDGVWTPAAGTFDSWPKQLSELKTLDPCCGSGHFLVAALLMLVAMRMELERLSAKDAVDAVLRDNLHGLEIDQRCVELAAFALALAAWRYPDAGGYRQLPELNIACSGLAINAKKEEWTALAGDNNNLQYGLEELYKQFKDAPMLGSLINPAIGLAKGTLKEMKWDEVGPLLMKALSSEKDDEKTEMGVVARGIANAALLLSDKYHWIITNVPYLARGKQGETLREYCEKHHPTAKNDLATVFLDRCLKLCVEGGTSSIVLPQNWLFLTSYNKLREKLLKEDILHLIARLGEGGFESSSAAGAFTVLITLSRNNIGGLQGGLVDTTPKHKLIRGLDVSQPRTAAEKASALLTAQIKQADQVKELENPDARIILEEKQINKNLLDEYTECYQGMRTGEKEQFLRNFWELANLGSIWELFRNSNISKTEFGGMHEVVMWEKGKGRLHAFARERRGMLHDMHESGNRAWGKMGVSINQMRQLKASRFNGEKFDGNVSVIFPKKEEHLPAIWCFCCSPEYNEAVRRIDQKLNVTNATLVKVPFDLDYWTKTAAEKYPNGLPKPYSDDPTQWIYHGHPVQSDEPLQVAVARLLGYRWPAELDSTMELSDEARAWIKKTEALLPYADKDGLVCIPAVRGEMKAEDRLENLLAAAYGSEWSSNKKSELLAQADHAGKTMETWLREKFFTQHCKLFQHRPFIWHIWDGLNDGFGALVNYHKLDAKLLETLIYNYLGDWINRQKQDKANGVDGADEKLAAAEALKKRLELILEGEAPYDIFVRWKPIEKQPIGWNPDLNDGVRLNIRPFMRVPDVGKKSTGVLRDRPNIKWDKDRGKDVESAPWYKLGTKYGGKEGDRINDPHLSLAEKRAVKNISISTNSGGDK